MKTHWIPFDHTVFDALTPEARYWIGFLLADGCLTLAKRKRKNGKTVFYKMVAVSLMHSDIGHLKKLRTFLKSEHRITEFHYIGGFGRAYETRFAARFSFISPHIFDLLCHLGVKPRKTKGCSIHASLADDRNFWRGVVDGDGSIGLSFNKPLGRIWPIVQLDGCLQLLKQFSAFVTKLTHRTYTVSKHKAVKNFGRLKVGGQPAITILRLLYSEASIALERKQNAVLNYLAQG